MIMRPALNANVESPIVEKDWNLRNVRIGSIQNAKRLMKSLRENEEHGLVMI